MKQYINQLKPRHFWDIVIVMVSVYSMFVVSSKLDKLDGKFDKIEYAKLEVTDIDQVETIAEHLTKDEWNASGYAMYIMQPKDYKKTYKELVASSKTHVLPNRVNLANEIELELELYNNRYVKLTSTNTKKTSYTLLNDEVCVIIPIYQHRVVIAELYIFFESDKESDKFVKTLNNKIVEAQVLGQLVQ